MRIDIDDILLKPDEPEDEPRSKWDWPNAAFEALTELIKHRDPALRQRAVMTIRADNEELARQLMAEIVRELKLLDSDPVMPARWERIEKWLDDPGDELSDVQYGQASVYRG